MDGIRDRIASGSLPFPVPLHEVPELYARLDEAYRRHQVVELVGAAGTGKSTGVGLYAHRDDRSWYWRTVGALDRSAHRFVQSLAELVAGIDPDVPAFLHRLFGAGATPADAAASIAERVPADDQLLVLDACQVIADEPEALAALDAFLAGLPPGVRVVVCSDIPLPWHHTGLPRRQRTRVHTDGIEEDVRNWVAQALIALGADPSAVAGAPLATTEGEVLECLRQVMPRRLFEALTTLSVPEHATRDDARALGLEPQWQELRSARIPYLAVDSGGLSIHPTLREQLRTRLAQGDPEVRRRVHAVHLASLERSGRFEEGTEILLSAGHWEHAFEWSARALDAVVRRGDWEVVRRWSTALGAERIQRSPRWTAAQIRADHGCGDMRAVRATIRSADVTGRLKGIVSAAPHLLAAVTCAAGFGPDETIRLMEKYHPEDPRGAVVRYYVDVAHGDAPAPLPENYQAAGLGKLVAWSLLLQGRLDHLDAMVPAGHEPLLNPSILLGQAFLGRAERGMDLWERVPRGLRDRPHNRYVHTALKVANGDWAGAGSLLRSLATSPVGEANPAVSAYRCSWGYFLLLDAGPQRAIDWLEPLVDTLTAAGQRAYSEWARCFLGAALLAAGRDDEALTHLEECTASMVRSGRRLMLPMAALALSEARFRAGDAPGAAEAADNAYDEALAVGSLEVLTHALRQLPQVLRRQVRTDGQGSRWSRLVATPSTGRTRTEPSRDVEEAQRSLILRPFGDPSLWVDGSRVAAGRFKVLELVLLLVHNPRGLTRAEIVNSIFPDTDARRAGNYYRQVVHHFSRSTGLALVKTGESITFAPGVEAGSLDQDFERLVDNSNKLWGEGRAARLESALALYCGRFMVDSDLAWVTELRQRLELIREEALLELASIYLEGNRVDTARQLCEDVLAPNPYSDAAYRLLFTIERVVGSEASMTFVHRRASKALGELGLVPGEVRRILLQG
ncbi:BTAD domain-containing putative transcriptional regulator [Georgenia sp. AZ-5]|uniref:BTAD domain-containing putative transcriptional regulator n=1 Tax=Georgenia sp. AZ-5 TaxID=3367526 RepID=UPI003754D434